MVPYRVCAGRHLEGHDVEGGGAVADDNMVHVCGEEVHALHGYLRHRGRLRRAERLYINMYFSFSFIDCFYSIYLYLYLIYYYYNIIVIITVMVIVYIIVVINIIIIVVVVVVIVVHHICLE